MINRDIERIGGACHCGAVRFEVTLMDGLHTAARCNCSYCRMRGAVAVAARMDALRFLAGEDNLRQYRFNTMTAVHHFCSTCGIYTHHQRRFDSCQCGVNVACLEGISPFDFQAVPVVDGVNHPSDTKTGTRIAGFLHYVPVG